VPELILGNYEILDRLGSGGMGTVYRARHRRMKRLVAVKILPVGPADKPHAAVLRFQREVEVVAQLSHPNIVTAHDADEAEVGYYLVMELIDGPDLAREVKTHGPLPVRRAVAVLLQAARGLEYAHGRGVVHRDVKPGNLLWDRAGTVKVTDLGLARVHEALAESDDATNPLTESGHIFGTADYMPPEQANDFHAVDPRGDVYSLGCTQYYLLTGRSPYRGRSAMETLLKHRDEPIPPLSDAGPEVPPALEAIYRKMMAKSPEDRFGSMTDLIAALERCGYRADEAGTPRGPAPVVAASEPTRVSPSVCEPTSATRPDNVRESGWPLAAPPRPRSTGPSFHGPLWVTLFLVVAAVAGVGLWWMPAATPQLRGQWTYDDGQGTQGVLAFASDADYTFDLLGPDGAVQQAGGYRLAGDRLVLRDGDAERHFRVRVVGDQLTLTPLAPSGEATRPAMTFQRQGTGTTESPP